MLELEELTGKIIGAAIRVHKELGPGYVESVYEEALVLELAAAGIPFERQKLIRVYYRGQLVGEQRLDLLVDKTVVVELKAVSELLDIFFARTRSYLKALDLKHGLILNFATMPLTIKRVHREPSHKD